MLGGIVVHPCIDIEHARISKGHILGFYGVAKAMLFADGYIEWLCEEFAEEIDRNDINTIFKVLDHEVRNNKGGYSFYDYTHYMYCID